MWRCREHNSSSVGAQSEALPIWSSLLSMLINRGTETMCFRLGPLVDFAQSAPRRRIELWKAPKNEVRKEAIDGKDDCRRVTKNNWERQKYSG